MSEDLIAFVTARLDEDEAMAKAMVAAFGGVAEWVISENGEFDYTVTAGQLATDGVADIWREDAAEWVARHDPARVLREVSGKRAIVGRYGISANQVVIHAVNGNPAESGAWEKIAGGLELDVRSLAAVWSGHPDYRPEWTP